ncbi:MAG: siderophore-interacting protein [Moraxellaceae bacterium]
MANVPLTFEQDNDEQASPRTPLNAPELTNIITYINEEHLDELLGFLSVFTTINLSEWDTIEVQLTRVYAEGIELQWQPKNPAEQSTSAQSKFYQRQTVFIAFPAAITHPDELQTQYIALKQRADKKLGKKTIKLIQQTFIVEDSYNVSENMLRLELSVPELSDSDPSNKPPSSVPINEAGYAYLFDLEHNALIKDITADNIDDSKNTSRLARSHCYYTLRKAWQTPAGIQAWVDVFLHGNTPGGNWANSLQAGDTVVTKREFPEKVEHLRDGQALLIADETSMPTVARLLELWENPTPPLVVSVTQNAADQRYFDTVKIRSGIDIGSMNNSIDSNSERTIKNTVKDNFTVFPIVTDQQCSGQHLASLIDNTIGNYLTDQPLKIDKVWGALEASTVKALRPMLRERLDLSRAEVVIKVYWRQD